LAMLSWFGIVWDLRIPPAHIKAKIFAPENALHMWQESAEQ
jgi:hypothetical protein